MKDETMAKRNVNRWSQHVTETSNALDLDVGLFSRDDAHVQVVKALGGSKPATQKRSVPVSDVDAHVLHQPRRQESLHNATDEA